MMYIIGKLMNNIIDCSHAWTYKGERERGMNNEGRKKLSIIGKVQGNTARNSNSLDNNLLI